MTTTLPTRDHAFLLKGQVAASSVVLKAASTTTYTPARRMGGWATTYGQLVDGVVVPTQDRDGHFMDAAREAGGIDWTQYIRGGLWNDGHRAPLPDGRPTPIMQREGRTRGVYVGVATSLAFEGPDSPRAQAEGKVGFWTEGHLWDRRDPRSWTEFTDYRPTAEDLLRADAYWTMATVLKSSDGRLGFSVHGTARISGCGRRILGARIGEIAVVTSPCHPDATVDLLAGVDGDVLAAIGRARASGAPCGRCSCPAGACVALLKGDEGAVTSDTTAPVVPEDLEPDATITTFTAGDLAAELERALIERGADRETARRYVDAHLPQLILERAVRAEAPCLS